jgi:hypothetical protein
MARNGFQQAAYTANLAQVAGQFQQVVASITGVQNTMASLTAAQTRLTAALTTPDDSFGTSDQSDVTQLDTWLAQWTTVQSTAMSFEQAVAAFLSAPPQV